jgi:hypothetical protein
VTGGLLKHGVRTSNAVHDSLGAQLRSMGDLVAQLRSMGDHGHEGAGSNDEGPRREELRWGYTLLRSGLKFGLLNITFFVFRSAF